MPTDLASCAGLRTDLSTEGVDLLDDQTLHALNRVLFFESIVERLDGTSVPTFIGMDENALTDAHTGSSAGSCQTARYG